LPTSKCGKRGQNTDASESTAGSRSENSSNCQRFTAVLVLVSLSRFFTIFCDSGEASKFSFNRDRAARLKRRSQDGFGSLSVDMIDVVWWAGSWLMCGCTTVDSQRRRGCPLQLSLVVVVVSFHAEKVIECIPRSRRLEIIKLTLNVTVVNILILFLQTWYRFRSLPV